MTRDAAHEPRASTSKEATSRSEGLGAAYAPGRQRTPNFGRRRRLRHRLLRAVLLLALVSGVGGLASMFLQGRRQRAAADPAAIAEQAVETGGEAEALVESAQLSAEEFESTLEREGVEVFRIRGARTSSDDQGNVNLSQVDVDYPQGDDHYSLRADGATYNEETSATHLQGAVSLEGTNGLAVDTEWMDLAEGGMVLTAADDSRFGFEGVTVRGDDLRVDFREETARMGGGVRLVGTGDSDSGVDPERSRAFSLTADALEYRWRSGVVRALGGTAMQLGSFTLSARSLTLHEGETGGLARLEARGEIELRAPFGTAEPEAEGSVFILRGDAMDVRFDEGQAPGRVHLSGPGWGGPAVLRIDRGDGSRRRIRARLLEFSFLEGVLAEFASRGRVELHEFVPGSRRPLREASSVVAGGRFDAEGVLAELTLGGNVELTDRSEAAVFARADEAIIDPSGRRVDLRGQPARLVHSQGELEGSRILRDQANGCSEASGGVRFALRGDDAASGGVLPFGGALSPGGESSEAVPSAVAADEAILCDAGESRFRGDVEVRRGPDLLAAAQLRVTEDRRRMVANGDVRTVWHASPVGGARTAGEGGTGIGPERWSIDAARMNYNEDSGELRYGGGVAAVLGEQSLECDELTVETIPVGQDPAPGGLQAERLFCLGAARLDDLGDGRTVEANRAIYALGERTIRFAGGVVLRGGADELRGPGLIYWIDQRRYEMRPSGSSAVGAGDP